MISLSRGSGAEVANLDQAVRLGYGLLSFFRGRLTVGRQALNLQALARLQPPELDRCPWSVVDARRSAKAEVMQVRFLPGIL